jgi:hypothetical protein
LAEVGFYYRIRQMSMARAISPEERDYTERYVHEKHFQFYLSNYDLLNSNRKKMEYKLKSEKYVLNLFTKMFFGFKFFKQNK